LRRVEQFLCSYLGQCFVGNPRNTASSIERYPPNETKDSVSHEVFRSFKDESGRPHETHCP
jgi:hypothetical protein